MVAGVGTMGSMALWRLAERNVSVVGIERFDIGHARGAAGGESRIFRTAYKEGREYVPLLRHAHQYWQELERHAGETLLIPTGALTIGRADHPDVAEVIASGIDFGLDLRIHDTVQARTRYPQHRFFEDEVAVHDPSGGILLPSLAVRTATKLATQNGAQVISGSIVREIHDDGHQVKAVLDDRTITADRAIVSLGPWTKDLLPGIGQRCEIRRSVLHWFKVDNPGLFAGSRFPVGIRRSGAGRDLSFFPSADGKTIKVNLHTSREVVADPETFDGTIDSDYSAMVGRQVSSLFHGVAPKSVRAQGFMEGYSPDNHGIVGTPRGLPNVTVLSAFSGHGFKLAPAIGEAAADLATAGSTSLPITHLSASREFCEHTHNHQ